MVRVVQEKRVIVFTYYYIVFTYLHVSVHQGGSRRSVVVEEKRAIVAASEEKFQAQVYKFTTDEDMPAYSGFEFST